MNLTIDIARRVLEASKQRAIELRSPVSIAIVDSGGHLVLFERMMSPYGWATGNISIAKASTAVMFNQSTDAVAQWGSGIPGFASSMATMSEGKFIMAAGGWPIRVSGATIGGIVGGVSGAAGGVFKGGGRFTRKLSAKTLRHDVQYLPYRMADSASGVVNGEGLTRTHYHFAHSRNVVEMDIVSYIVRIAEDSQRSVMKQVIDRHADQSLQSLARQ